MIHLTSEDIIGTIEDLDQLDLQVPIEGSRSIDVFSNWVKSILKKPQDDQPKDGEHHYQDQVHDLPNGPKTAEILPMEDVLARDLLTTLDFNPKLTSNQKSKLEQVIFENSRAFSIKKMLNQYP